MTITDKAKNYIKKEIIDDTNDVLEIRVSNSCCSEGECIHLGSKSKEYKMIINDIKIWYQDEYYDYIDRLIIDYDKSIIFDAK